MGTLLIAAREEEQAILRELLGRQHHLLCCADLHGAAAQLERDIDAILCSPHFDEGQLFELLELARLQAGSRTTPLYAVVAESRPFSRHVVDGRESARVLLGGQGVLDFAGWRRTEGEEEARQRLQRAVANIVDGAARSGPARSAPNRQLLAA